jgi:hypothetical protein
MILNVCAKPEETVLPQTRHQNTCMKQSAREEHSTTKIKLHKKSGQVVPYKNGREPRK